MSNVEAIKKAMEKVYIGEWYIFGVKNNGLSIVQNYSDSSMFPITAETYEAQYVVAVNPAAVSELLTTLEALQRENVQLRTDASNHAADAETVRRERDAADARESNLRAALTKLVREAGEVSNIGAVPGRQWTLLAGALINARTALASAGEHHAE